MTIKDLKVNDIFYMEGLTHNGELVNRPAKLIAYLGMNKYQIDTDGIGMIAYADDKVTVHEDTFESNSLYIS
jgi:hypothetical protein